MSNGQSMSLSNGNSFDYSNGGSAASIGPSSCEPWYFQIMKPIQDRND